MSMSKFADFWRAMFYCTSTVTMGVLLYLLVVVWQPLWTGGFKDFGSISEAIAHLDATTKPTAEIAPLMLEQMKIMNQNMQSIQHSVQTMEQSVQNMDMNMYHMRVVMGYQMGSMSNQMGKINNRFSPWGMMPFNW